MINFRFHIISLTAVFLSFAVGLVLGTNFLADASKNYLETRLDNLEDLLEDERATNDDLRGEIGSFESEGQELDEQVGERLFTGQLTADPVLVIASRGLQGESGPVERVLSALDQADADTVGVWWLTDRLQLDDEDEVTELAAVLESGDTDADALRDTLGSRLAEVLAAATDTGADDAGPGLTAAQTEPDLLVRLREAGFLDYEIVGDSESDVVELPSSGLRVAAVTGEDAEVRGDEVLLPLLSALAADAPVPVVVTETTPVPDDDPETDDVEPLVATIREDNDLSERIATVDDLDRVSGRIATILALDDAAPTGPLVGHYGLRSDADRLLPAPPE